MQAFRAAQRFLRHEQAMLLFDEIEDVFQGDSLPGLFGTCVLRSGAGRRCKGWNRRAVAARTNHAGAATRSITPRRPDSFAIGQWLTLDCVSSCHQNGMP